VFTRRWDRPFCVGPQEKRFLGSSEKEALHNKKGRERYAEEKKTLGQKAGQPDARESNDMGARTWLGWEQKRVP